MQRNTTPSILETQHSVLHKTPTPLQCIKNKGDVTELARTVKKFLDAPRAVLYFTLINF